MSLTIRDPTPCDRCGAKCDYRTGVHRFENPDGKEIMRLCATCCPNCWGGPGKNKPERKESET